MVQTTRVIGALRIGFFLLGILLLSETVLKGADTAGPTSERAFLVCLAVIVADVDVGDKAVTLTTAPVMRGSEKLAEVEPGVELTVNSVKSPWVGVTVWKSGKETQGWILDKHLIPEPTLAFTRLVTRVGEVSCARWPSAEFTRIDGNRDGLLISDEFVAGTRLGTSAELNERLSKVLGPGLGQGMAAANKHLRIMSELANFPGWKRKMYFEEFMAMATDFARTRDIRRSPTAQQFLDREAPLIRASRAQVLFAWADGDHDSRLSRQEFEQAVIPSPAGSRGGSQKLPYVFPKQGPMEDDASEADILRLIHDLQHQSTDVRIRAAHALARIGRDANQAVPALAKALRDESGSVRIRAAHALLRIGPGAREAVPALIKALQQPPQSGRPVLNIDSRVQTYAAEALGEIGSDARAAIPALRELVQLENPSVKHAAAEALRRIGSEQ